MDQTDKHFQVGTKIERIVDHQVLFVRHLSRHGFHIDASSYMTRKSVLKERRAN